MLDLPSHPQVPAPGEGLGQRRLDLVVEAPNREDALPNLAFGLRPLRAGRRLVETLLIPDGRRLGVEEPAGTARRRD
jgi:hypothetical protein